MDLASLGWSPFFASSFEREATEGCVPARVAIPLPAGRYLLYGEQGDFEGVLAGRLEYLALGPGDLPAVGDWVVVRVIEGSSGLIVSVLPRRSKFSRRAAGKKGEEQVAAANVDYAFLVNALDARFSLRRLERYLVTAAESGAEPVILLNKADLCDAIDGVVAETRGVAPGVPIHVMSAARGDGVEVVRSYLTPGITGALLGSSGVGKSTIINVILGEEYMRTQEVREDDDRGRHTTSHRELVLLPGGGLLIDTPGMRELHLSGVGEGLLSAFDDIEELALSCKFTNCRHEEEPSCAVRAALEEGRLAPERLGSYRKLLREIAYQGRQGSPREEKLYKDRMKKLTSKHKRGYRG